MRKLSILLTGVIAILLINSCEVEKPVRYFEIDGVRHDLNVAYMDDWGTNSSGSINTRYYAVSLRSSSDYPNNYITFLISSLGTDDLHQGNYIYKFAATRGEFSDLRVGSNIKYDRNDVPIDGIVFAEEKVEYDGVIRISRASNGNFNFFFDITMTVKEDYLDFYPQKEFKLFGEYNDRLTRDTQAVDLDWY